LRKGPYTPRQVHGFWSGWGWFVVPDWNLTIAAPPKAGSSSLKKFFYESEMDNVRMIPHNEVNPNSKIFYVVREPLDRFKSLWRGKCRDRDNIRDRRVYGMQPDELMQHILAGQTDIHWTPQVTLLNQLGGNVTLIPLALLGFWWKQSGFGKLDLFNSTEGEVEIDQSLKDQVLTFYSEDVILHNQAESSFCWDTLYPQLKQ